MIPFSQTNYVQQPALQGNLYPAVAAPAIQAPTYQQLNESLEALERDVRNPSATKENLNNCLERINLVKELTEGSIALHAQGAPQYQSVDERAYRDLIAVSDNLERQAQGYKAALKANGAIDDMFGSLFLPEEDDQNVPDLMGQHIVANLGPVVNPGPNSTTTTTTTPNVSGRMTLQELANQIVNQTGGTDSDSDVSEVDSDSDVSEVDSDSDVSEVDSDSGAEPLPIILSAKSVLNAIPVVFNGLAAWASSSLGVSVGVDFLKSPTHELNIRIGEQEDIIADVAKESKGKKLDPAQIARITLAEETLQSLRICSKDNFQRQDLADDCKSAIIECRKLLAQNGQYPSVAQQLDNMQQSLHVGSKTSFSSSMPSAPIFDVNVAISNLPKDPVATQGQAPGLYQRAASWLASPSKKSGNAAPAAPQQQASVLYTSPWAPTTTATPVQSTTTTSAPVVSFQQASAAPQREVLYTSPWATTTTTTTATPVQSTTTTSAPVVSSQQASTAPQREVLYTSPWATTTTTTATPVQSTTTTSALEREVVYTSRWN